MSASYFPPGPPEIDLGVQPTTFHDAEGRATTRRMRHRAVVVDPIALPEIVTELRQLHYGEVRPRNATALQHHAFLAAVAAALSNAIWQL